MSLADDLRQRARATWAAGDWDRVAGLITPVGARVIDHVGVDAGQDVLDVGTERIERMDVDFVFGSEQSAVEHYTEHFGPFVIARSALEPQGRWDGFVVDFGGLVGQFNAAGDGSASISSEYLLITVDR
jgi:hypothetical protein